MPGSRAVSAPDRGQRRASLAQARSKETKRALVQAAMALWRTSGYATTTVADICRAAGVSKALFYFYFPRKEDVLFEVGVMSTRSAQRVVADMLVGDYDMPAVIAAALSDLERSMARNPRELIIETILEATATNTGSWRIPPADSAATPPRPRQRDVHRAVRPCRRRRKTATHTDVTHLAYLAMTLVSEGARHWAAGAFGNRPFADVVGADIVTLIAGYQRS